jgi:hypothetical protein
VIFRGNSLAGIRASNGADARANFFFGARIKTLAHFDFSLFRLDLGGPSCCLRTVVSEKLNIFFTKQFELDLMLLAIGFELQHRKIISDIDDFRDDLAIADVRESAPCFCTMEMRKADEEETGRQQET